MLHTSGVSVGCRLTCFLSGEVSRSLLGSDLGGLQGSRSRDLPLFVFFASVLQGPFGSADCLPRFFSKVPNARYFPQVQVFV